MVTADVPLRFVRKGRNRVVALGVRGPERVSSFFFLRRGEQAHFTGCWECAGGEAGLAG